jgi:hypothetical protein
MVQYLRAILRNRALHNPLVLSALFSIENWSSTRSYMLLAAYSPSPFLRLESQGIVAS